MSDSKVSQADIMKKEVARAVRVLANGRILTLNVGHVSYKLDDDRILILGHTHKLGKTLSSVTENDIVLIDLDGRLVEGDVSPPGERFIHTEIYRRRPDVKSVIHAHPVMLTAFSVSGTAIRPAFTRGIQFHPAVRVMEYAGQVNTPALGERLADELGNDCALLLRGHGVVVTGSSIEEACCNAFHLNMNAEIQLMATIAGGFRPLSPEEVSSKDERGEKHVSTSVWPYFLEQFDR